MSGIGVLPMSMEFKHRTETNVAVHQDSPVYAKINGREPCQTTVHN